MPRRKRKGRALPEIAETANEVEAFVRELREGWREIREFGIDTIFYRRDSKMPAIRWQIADDEIEESEKSGLLEMLVGLLKRG